MPEYRFPEIEGSYARQVPADHRKKLGQFFTPPRIATFMAEWILEGAGNDPDILDPACGLGIFERVLHEVSDRPPRFDLWEIDATLTREVSSVLDRQEIDYRLACGDFLHSGWHKRYDAVISNPPYYKHHHLDDKEGIVRTFKEQTGFGFSVQTNIYCWFLLKCLHQLKAGGRLAFLIPSEFLNANYGVAVKEYLLQADIGLTLIDIDCTVTVFDHALTTSLILLAEKERSPAPDPNPSIAFASLGREQDLGRQYLRNGAVRRRLKSGLDPAEKWKNYFGHDGTSGYGNLVPIRRFGRFSRGIATGANDYFTVSKQDAEAYELPPDCLVSCISKANQVQTPVFTDGDYRKLRAGGANVHLFDGEAASGSGVERYLGQGIRNGVNHRYLTRKREPWYALEQRDISRIWITAFSRGGIKVVWNDSSCVTLTCFHNFFPSRDGRGLEKLVYLYLLTDLAGELLDREKREYGNGLYKLEPNDISKTKIVDLSIMNEEDCQRLEKLHAQLRRKGEITEEITAVADEIFRSYV